MQLLNKMQQKIWGFIWSIKANVYENPTHQFAICRVDGDGNGVGGWSMTDLNYSIWERSLKGFHNAQHEGSIVLQMMTNMSYLRRLGTKDKGLRRKAGAFL